MQFEGDSFQTITEKTLTEIAAPQGQTVQVGTRVVQGRLHWTLALRAYVSRASDETAMATMVGFEQMCLESPSTRSGRAAMRCTPKVCVGGDGPKPDDARPVT